MGRFERITDDESGLVFVFKYDATDPTQLHIWVRHLKEPEDAIDAWFNGTNTWNETNRRFEAIDGPTTVTWYWLDQPTTVMTTSCYD